MKIILESERHIGKNPFDFLSTKFIPNGWWVSIGYINDHEISWGPKTRKSNIKDNDLQLTQYIESLPEGKFKQALIDFQNSPKYQSALETGKTAPFNIEGDVHIIKIGRFRVNWRNPDSFAKINAARNDAEQRIRAKHGFGKDEDSYPEDDWRRKYNGVGTRPISQHHGKQGNPYKAIGNSGFYAHIDNPDKISLRQISNPKASDDPIWLFIDADGNVEYLDYKLMAWLSYAYKGKRVKEEIKEISQEEQDFLNDLKTIKYNPEMTMLLDNILYLTGTTIDSNKQKEPFTWLNDDRIKELYPYIKVDELNKIIQKCIKKSTIETANMNKVMTTTNIDESLRKRNTKNIKQYNKLYESIMKDVSKIIKQKLR